MHNLCCFQRRALLMDENRMICMSAAGALSIWCLCGRTMQESKKRKAGVRPDGAETHHKKTKTVASAACPFLDVAGVACGNPLCASDPSRPACLDHVCCVVECTRRVLRFPPETGLISNLCPQHSCKAGTSYATFCSGLVVTEDGLCFMCAGSEYPWEGRSNCILDPLQLYAQVRQKQLLLKNKLSDTLSFVPAGIVSIVFGYVATSCIESAPASGSALSSAAASDPDAAGAAGCPFLIGAGAGGREMRCGVSLWTKSSPTRPTCKSHACAVDECGKRMVPWNEATFREGGKFLPVCPDHKCQGDDCYELIVSAPPFKLCVGCLFDREAVAGGGATAVLDPLELRRQLLELAGMRPAPLRATALCDSTEVEIRVT